MLSRSNIDTTITTSGLTFGFIIYLLKICVYQDLEGTEVRNPTNRERTVKILFICSL